MSEHTDAEAVPEETHAPEVHIEHEPTISVFNSPENMPAAGVAAPIPSFDAEYNPPPLSLLGEDKGKASTGDIKANANIIKRTFRTLGFQWKWMKYRWAQRLPVMP